MDTVAHSPFSLLPLRGSRRTGHASPAGTADLPSAVPAKLAEQNPLQATRPPAEIIRTLRAAIAGIERPSLQTPDGRRCQETEAWRMGCRETDALLPQGLETDSLHEVKAFDTVRGGSAADWMASLGFSLRLSALRLAAMHRQDRPGVLLWCWPRVMAQELGHLSGRGMGFLGLDPSRIIIVETAREAEALQALEEGLKSGTLALALGVFEEVSLNAARRLSLAAQARRTPCLITTHPAREAAAGCATRWRVCRARSAPHPFDAKAPGLSRFTVTLERCRARPQSAGLPPLSLEWCDETLRFRMAAELAADAAFPRGARQSSRA